MKYDVYIEKEKEMVVRMAQMEDLEIPVTFDFDRVQSIGTEAKEKLKKIFQVVEMLVGHYFLKEA